MNHRRIAFGIMYAGIIIGGALLCYIMCQEECKTVPKKIVSEIHTEAPTIPEIVTEPETEEPLIEVEEAIAEVVGSEMYVEIHTGWEGGIEWTWVPAHEYYSINGRSLSKELQDWAYNCLNSFGHPEYFDIFICQMYQESNFNQKSVSKWGDYGICQLKEKYHNYFKKLCGHPEFDLINNAEDNIYVGAFLMCRYLDKCETTEQAISTYYTGVMSKYNATYVEHVLSWLPKLKVME